MLSDQSFMIQGRDTLIPEKATIRKLLKTEVIIPHKKGIVNESQEKEQSEQMEVQDEINLG